MDLFTAAVHTLLEVEGGVSDHSSDPGGLTNFGISQRAYPNLDIRSLTRSEAISIYHRDYWNRIPANLPDGLRWMAFDAAVNHGVGRALGWLEDHRTLSEFTAQRIRFFTNLGTFDVFGKGWMRRVAHVLDAISMHETAHGQTGVAHTLALHNLTVAERWAALSPNPVLRGSFVWRARGDKLDVRRAS